MSDNDAATVGAERRQRMIQVWQQPTGLRRDEPVV